jgi:hypothetical protein
MGERFMSKILMKIDEHLNEAKYTIYVDKNEKGQKSYTVYQGDKHIGVFLSDSPTLKKYMKQGQVKQGLKEAANPMMKFKAQDAAAKIIGMDVGKKGSIREQLVKTKAIKSVSDSVKLINKMAEIIMEEMG